MSFRVPHRASLVFVFLCFCLLVCPSVISAQSISILSPQKHHFAGQPLLFHLRTKGMVSPSRATVFYRAKGVTVYRGISMKKETTVDFRAALKAQKVTPPGIEYFFVVEDGKGQVFTLPETDPKKNPYFLDIELDKSPPRILDTLPSKGIELKETKPRIRVTFEDRETRVDTQSIRLLVDGVNVTRLSEITPSRIIYQPPASLSYGKHTVMVEMADVCGNRIPPLKWAFSVPKTPQIDNALAEVQWDGEIRHRIAQSGDSEPPLWGLQSSAQLKSLLEAGNFRTSFDADVWYTEEEGPAPEEYPFNLSNFLYQAQYGDQLAAVGDVTVQGTELISKSINRRGGRVEMNVDGVRVEGFMLRSNAITGFEHGLGVSDGAQRLVGGAVEKELVKEKKLSLRALYIRGRNKNPDNYNVGTSEAGTEGNAFSLALASRLVGEKLVVSGEYCGSRFDSDISDEFDQESDRAWRARVSGRGSRYDWEAGYRYLGPEFRSIVSPTGAYDREEVNLSGGLRALSSDFRLSLLHNQDNVKEDPLMPVIRNTMGTLNYSLAKAGWPGIFLNYTINSQASTNEPSGYVPIENQTRTIGGGISLSGDRWSLSPGYNFTAFDDRAASTNNDSRTHVATLSGSVQFLDTASVNPSLSYTRFHLASIDQTTETYQGAVGAVIGFLDNALNLNATVSILDSQTDDDTSHTTTFSSIAQMNWHVENYLLQKGKQTVSLRWQYRKTEDHIADDTDHEYVGYLVFSFGIPVPLY